jgi:type IV pilus assembly protein PilB
MANIQRMSRKKLGEILVQAGVIDDLQLQAALTEQARTKELLGEVLVRRGFVTETDIVQTIALQFSLPYLSAEQIELAPAALDLLPLDLMRQHQVVPLDRFGPIVTVLCAGLLNTDLLNQIEQHTGCEVQLFITTATDVKTLIGRIEERASAEEPAPAVQAT